MMNNLFKFILISICITLWSHAAPEIDCVHPVFNFGERFEGEKLTHEFTLTNLGDQELVIGKVRACCGTTAQIDTHNIKPGKSAIVTINVSLKNRKGDLKKVTWISSNDQKTPLLGLYTEGHVKPASAYVTPRFINLGEITTSDKITKTITFNAVKETDLSTLTAIPNNEFLTATIKSRKGKTAEIEISLKQPLPTGKFSGSVNFRLSDSHFANFFISARVESVLNLTPSTITLINQTQPVKRYIAVRSADDTRFNIKNITSTAYITSKTTPLKRGGYRIELTLPPLTTNTSLIIETTHPSATKLELPLHVIRK